VNEQLAITHGSVRLAVSVRRSERATLEITVTPDGNVEVVAPVDATVHDIVTRVRRRSRWIQSQQRYFDQFRPRTPTRRWVPGETHRYLGRPYRLRIGDPEAPRGVTRTRGFLVLDGVSYDNSDAIRCVVDAWMRRGSHEIFTDSIARVAGCFVDQDVAPRRVIVRRMSMRWGSMSADGSLTLNPALVQGSIEMIDYVVAHELAHRVVPDHSARFSALMDAVMPDHLQRKAALERALA
jgi:hypothetical protein